MLNIKNSLAISALGLFFVLGCGILSYGCFVTPFEDDDYVQVLFSLQIPQTPDQFTQTASSPWDEQGLFYLEAFPKYVRVAVETEDYELAYGTWPDPELGIGAGEGTDGEVGVELEIPAGSERRVRVLGYLLEGEKLVSFKEAKTTSIEPIGGEELDLTMEVVEYKTGTINFGIECENGTAGLGDIVEISLVDTKAQVIHPPVAVKMDENHAYHATLENIPVGRFHWLRVFVKNRSTNEIKKVDVRTYSMNVPEENQTQDYELKIDCS